MAALLQGGDKEGRKPHLDGCIVLLELQLLLFLGVLLLSPTAIKVRSITHSKLTTDSYLVPGTVQALLLLLLPCRLYMLTC